MKVGSHSSEIKVLIEFACRKVSSKQTGIENSAASLLGLRLPGNYNAMVSVQPAARRVAYNPRFATSPCLAR